MPKSKAKKHVARKRQLPQPWEARFWHCGQVPLAPKLNKLYDKLTEFRCDAEEEVEVYIERIEKFVDDNVANALKDYCQGATLHIYGATADEITLYLHCDEDGNEKRDIKRRFSLRDIAMELAEDSWAGTSDRADILVLAEHFETLARELRERHKETETSIIKVERDGRLRVVKEGEAT